MSKPTRNAQIVSSDFDQFASDVTMAVWNRLAQFPEFHFLEPHNYASMYAAIEKALKRYHRPVPEEDGR